MKKIIAMLFAGITLVSCGSAVPDEVQNALKKKFPKAESVAWEKENENEWEADFKLDGVEYSASFTPDGTWIETEFDIAVGDLPESVKNTLSTEFKEYKITEAEIVESPNFSGFEVEVKKGKKQWELLLDANGKIKEKKIEDEDDD